MARGRRTGRKKNGAGAAKWAAILLVWLLMIAGAGAWLVMTPYGPTTETFVEIAPGSGTLKIGQQLEQAGIVRSGYAFDLMRWWKRGSLRAGEYRFAEPATVGTVYGRIARGDVYTKTVVVPEGANVFDIAARMEQAGLGTQRAFLEAAEADTKLIKSVDPGATSLEGYLFPDTYHFARKATPEQICAMMVRRFRAVAAQLGLKENIHRVVTMASLVERETAVDAERPLVASVFTNRLAKKMPLETDPAVIYGLELEGRWTGTIYASDLKYDTPYNTYLHAGLPPGPVANPGARSLRAAMAPAATNYLFFVAAGSDAQGRSVFTSSLKEHHSNVTGYRHALKKAGRR